jgi:hypothetical protein
MVTRQNPPHGIDRLFVLLDDDNQVTMLEGRPAIYEAQEHAERARSRTPRPARHRIAQVERLEAAGRVLLKAPRTRPNPTPIGG